MKAKEKQKFNFKKVKFAMIALAVSGCVAYLCVINMGAVKGYEIRKIEKRIAELKKERENLQIEEAELNSFYNIKEDISELEMVEAKNVVYINDNTQVAYQR